MNVIQRLTLKHMMTNKKRTLMTMAGVIISVAMLTAVATILFSMQSFLLKREFHSSGKWHIGYRDVEKANVDEAYNFKGIEHVLLSKDIGYSALENYTDPMKPYLFVKSYDDSAFEQMPVVLTDGRYPQNEREIIIPQHLLDEGYTGYEIGDTIELKIGQRYSLDDMGEEFTMGQGYGFQDYFEGLDDEEFRLTGEVYTYEIVGIIERPRFEDYFAPGYTLITYLNMDEKSASDLVNVSVYFSKVNSKLFDWADELQQLLETSDNYYSINYSVLTYQGQGYDSGFNMMLTLLSAMLIIIIIIGSVSLIYNSFAISLAEKSRYLGMLASVGATKRQKRMAVYFESFAVGIVSIPLGIIAGIAGIAVTLRFVGPMILNSFWDVRAQLVVVVKPQMFIIVILCAALTLFISAYIPARKASKITPIDAIRQTGDIELRSRKVRTSWLTKKLFGFEGDLAMKNLKRFKGRYRATIFSLFISIVLFMTATGYTFYLEKAQSLTVNQAGYDAYIYMDDDLEEMQDYVSQAGSIYRQVYMKRLAGDFYLDEETTRGMWSDDSWEIINERIEEYGDLLRNYSNIGMIFYALDDDAFAEYLVSQGINPDNWQEDEIKGVLINRYVVIEGQGRREIDLYNAKVGDTLQMNMCWSDYYSGNYDFETGYDMIFKPAVDIKVGATAVEVPDVLTLPYYFGDSMMFIVSAADMEKLQATIENVEDIDDENYETYYYNYDMLMLYSNQPDRLEDELKEIMGESVYEAKVYNYYQDIVATRQLVMALKIFAFGFIGLITLICAVNIFNTISTSFMLRKREFAIIRSTGMAPKDFNKMVYFECLMYGVKALLYGLPVGLLICVLIYRQVGISYGFDFSLPWSYIIIAAVAVFAVSGSAMIYASRKLKKENLIDTIKNENI